MGWLGDVLIVIIVLAVLAPIVGLYVRRRWLSNRGGVFDCSLRAKLSQPAWMLGLARYEGDTLEWYRIFSVSFWPKIVVHRGNMEIVGRREPTEAEALALYASVQIVRVEVSGGKQENFELALSSDSYTGLMSWIEAGPRYPTYPSVE